MAISIAGEPRSTKPQVDPVGAHAFSLSRKQGLTKIRGALTDTLAKDCRRCASTESTQGNPVLSV